MNAQEDLEAHQMACKWEPLNVRAYFTALAKILVARTGGDGEGQAWDNTAIYHLAEYQVGDFTRAAAKAIIDPG